MGSTPDIPHDDIYMPEWSDYSQGKGMKGFHRIVTDSLFKRNAGQAYRQAGYDRTAAQQLSAEQGIRDAAAQAYGGNNPTGLTGALIAQSRARAPYAAIDMAAREAGRQSALTAGQALQNLKQGHANWWSTATSPFLQNKNIETSAALNLAQMNAMGSSPTGSSSGNSGALLGAGIGATGSIVSALLMAGVI